MLEVVLLSFPITIVGKYIHLIKCHPEFNPELIAHLFSKINMRKIYCTYFKYKILALKTGCSIFCRKETLCKCFSSQFAEICCNWKILKMSTDSARELWIQMWGKCRPIRCSPIDLKEMSIDFADCEEWISSKMKVTQKDMYFNDSLEDVVQKLMHCCKSEL